MAEQKVSNERRKELEQLDPFQENLIQGLAFLKEHQKQFVIGVTAVLSVIIVFSGVMISLKKSEETAALMVSRSLNQYAKINDPAKGYIETKDDFETIFQDYSNTEAGKQAKVKFAKICYDASKFDQSFNYYKQALDIYEDQALMQNFLLTSLGHVSIAKKDFEAAKSYFLKVENSESDLLKDEAQMSLAMLLELSNKKDESKEKYQKIVSDFNSSMYLPLAKSKLSAIK